MKKKSLIRLLAILGILAIALTAVLPAF